MLNHTDFVQLYSERILVNLFNQKVVLSTKLNLSISSEGRIAEAEVGMDFPKAKMRLVAK